jgi:hypothetical protein
MPDLNHATDLAGFLAAARTADPDLTVQQLEALLLIAAGQADHVSDLRHAMGTPDGQPLSQSTATQLSCRLRGRGRSSGCPVSWLRTRPHPHRQGLQLLLGTTARELIRTYGVVTTPGQSSQLVA